MKRFALASAALCLLLLGVGPSYAQQTKNQQVVSVFREVVARPSQSTVRVLVNGKEAALGAVVADCVPILLYDPGAHVIACVHAGWRGTVARVTGAALAAMATLGTRPGDVIAGIGPAIGPDRYQVGEEVAQAVRECFGERAGQVIRPDGTGRWLCDLWSANQRGGRWVLAALPAVVLVALALFLVPTKPVASALLVAAVAAAPRVQKFLGAPVFAFLGRASFGLYLVHMPVFCSLGCGVYLFLCRRAGWVHSTAGLAASAISLMGSVLAAWLFYRLVDGPAIVTGTLRLYLFWNTVTPTISVFRSSLGRKTSAIRSSFHTQSAFTTTSVTNAGAERGTITRSSTRKCVAPSVSDDSISSRGIARKNAVSM